ncbi:hypothetical protein [Pseudomonas sp. GM41(2012)]|uniref:hypothetical protein n=1 Tax=Pseudomonas sp. (strain GM41(2012)) TaxID=1144708 RepID=UPI0012373F10|nr:hypothetical protein [Pseudomonas sp. GM41(2012)]
MKIKYLALPWLVSFFPGNASADIWVWYLNRDPAGPYLQMAENEDEALGLAREHNETFDQDQPELWMRCGDGFFALMTFFPPGDPIRVEKRFGGACEQPSREKAYSAAIKSCMNRPECKAALADKRWAFDLSSFEHTRDSESLGRDCTYYVTSRNSCTEEINGKVQYSPFDLDDFLQVYGGNK